MHINSKTLVASIALCFAISYSSSVFAKQLSQLPSSTCPDYKTIKINNNGYWVSENGWQSSEQAQQHQDNTVKAFVGAYLMGIMQCHSSAIPLYFTNNAICIYKLNNNKTIQLNSITPQYYYGSPISSWNYTSDALYCNSASPQICSYWVSNSVINECN